MSATKIEFRVVWDKKDDAHERISADIMTIAGDVLAGLSDEIHEEEVRGNAATPMAKSLWKMMREYHSVLVAEAKMAAEKPKVEKGGEN
jgi:hypothetical protein